MPTKLQEPCEDEIKAAAYIQREVEAYIKAAGLTTDQLAATLGLVDVGVERLRRSTWSLTDAWRVASALSITLDVMLWTPLDECESGEDAD